MNRRVSGPGAPWLVSSPMPFFFRRRGIWPVGLLLAASLSKALHAQDAPGYTHDDFGGIGLLQMPTARMANDGELSFTATRVYPFTQYNVMLQPLPWMEKIGRASCRERV